MMEKAQLIEVTKLKLDSNNPRLPRTLSDDCLDQEQLVNHYYDFAVLKELIESMLINGFFQHEALIASREPDADGRHTVWEGNRRLSALKIINQDDCPSDIPIPLLSETSRHDLTKIPVVFVDSYDDVRKFIGYRHISGLKTWPAEAKARFVTEAVQNAINEGEENPFKAVGKEIGSNASGVRSYFLAELTLQAAEDEGADTSVIRRDRFAVWQRLWNSSGLKSYLDFPDTRTSSELIEAIKQTSSIKLKNVTGHLSTKDKGRYLVPDSRDLDRYGKVLANNAARKVFEETKDLQVASEIIESDVIIDRFTKVYRILDILYNEVAESKSNDLRDKGVVKLAKLIKAKAVSISSLIEAAEDE